jgi:hypothetical protein
MLAKRRAGGRQWQCNAIALKMLISAGADVHAEGRLHGFSAAMIVVQREDVALLEILIDSGVNMNIVDPKMAQHRCTWPPKAAATDCCTN